MASAVCRPSTAARKARIRRDDEEKKSKEKKSKEKKSGKNHCESCPGHLLLRI
jgi:hypothetical protein